MEYRKRESGHRETSFEVIVKSQFKTMRGWIKVMEEEKKGRDQFKRLLAKDLCLSELASGHLLGRGKTVLLVHRFSLKATPSSPAYPSMAKIERKKMRERESPAGVFF